MILLDTNILVSYPNGSPGIAQQLAHHLGEVAVPSLVAAELYYGASASARATENLEKLERLFRSLPVINFDLAAARVFGALKSALRQRVDRPVRPTPGSRRSPSPTTRRSSPITQKILRGFLNCG